MEQHLAQMRAELERILGAPRATALLARRLAELGLVDVKTADDLYDLGAALCETASDVSVVGNAAKVHALLLGARGLPRRRPALDCRISVLLVDDDVLVTRVLVRTLRPYPVDIDVADSFDAANDALEARRYDVVATDHQMAGLSGARLLDRVADEYPGIGRVLFSGTVPPRSLQDWLEQGRIDGWLQKPFLPARLFGTLAAARDASRARVV